MLDEFDSVSAFISGANPSPLAATRIQEHTIISNHSQCLQRTRSKITNITKVASSILADFHICYFRACAVMIMYSWTPVEARGKGFATEINAETESNNMLLS